MPLILAKKSDCEEYTVQANDTLESIAQAKCPGLGPDGWKMIALLNWSTHEKKEIVRALCESVGVKVAQLTKWEFLENPQKIALVPDTDLAPKLRIPKAWGKEGLALGKTHTVKVKPLPHPRNAVSLLDVDKWFIPAVETCNIEYGLEGDGATADKLKLDVFGSNYCECTAWNSGRGTYGSPNDLADEALFTKDLAGADQAEARRLYDLSGDAVKWQGQTTTTRGILGRKTGTAAERYVNVAFSPYTVHFRYWKADADQNARILLQPFWPQWEEVKTETVVNVDATTKRVAWTNGAKQDRGIILIRDKNAQLVYRMAVPSDKLGSGAQNVTWDASYESPARNSKRTTVYDAADGAYPATVWTYLNTKIDDTFKIKWKIKATDNLQRGLVKIVDKDGKVVFQKPLPATKLTKDTDHEIPWNGDYATDIKNTLDGTKAIPEDMPYRVEIEANGLNADTDGLALAATHTEVRLFVHPKTYLDTATHYDPAALANAALPGDPASLKLSLAPLYLGTAAPTDQTTRAWLQHELAVNGFHAGPVDGTDRAALQLAVKDFQRSVPKLRVGNTGPYSRLTVSSTGTADADTIAALAGIGANYRRPWFGNPTVLPNRTDYPQTNDTERNAISAILTDPAQQLIVWIDARHYHTTSDADQALMTIDNYHGIFRTGDGCVQDDANSTLRPWIPIKADLFLLSRTKGLADTDGASETDATKLEAMRKAIGPVRVDWTFQEIGPDLDEIGTRTSTRVRSRRFVDWVLDQKKATHSQKRPTRPAIFMNCPGGTSSLGGIRSTTIAEYYKAPFGHGDDESLRPWNARPVDADEAIATVVHDHLCATQPRDGEPIDAKSLGRAGVFFRPSIIAGDGYQLRAQVRFDKVTSHYEHPNVETLAKRYPRLPQACSAKLRNWRKTSVRGVIGWGSTTNHFDDFRTYYAGAHVHFVHELGTQAVYTPTQLIADGTAVTAYKTLIAGKCPEACNKDHSRMSLSDNYSYPWWDDDRLGWDYGSDPNADATDLTDQLVEVCESNTWGKFLEALLHHMNAKIEARDGRMRGHLIAPFVDTRQPYARKYKCQTCGDHYWYFEKTSTGEASVGRACPGACVGTGATGLQKDGACQADYQCAGGHVKGPWADNYPNGGKYDGCGCTEPLCTDTLSVNTVTETSAPSPPQTVRSIVDYGIGKPGGVTWLCNTQTAFDWAHEVGHHRQLEHCADAPTARTTQRDELHDSEANTLVANWGAIGVTDALNRRWDRCCVMSYVDLSAGYVALTDRPYFCGKCVLRGRGWKVQGIAGGPGTDQTVP